MNYTDDEKKTINDFTLGKSNMYEYYGLLDNLDLSPSISLFGLDKNGKTYYKYD